MSLNVVKSTQFFVHELIIVTKGGNVDISALYEEINIFDSIFLPVVSGKITINDSVGLSGKLLFDGSESLLMHISKGKDSDVGGFKKAFRIYNQSGRSNQSLTNEKYVLNFVSDELIFSDQQRINQSFEGTYTDIVANILTHYLKVPRNEAGGYYDITSGIKKIVIPNLRPFEAIEWCAKRAVDYHQSPNFIFFQNAVGYNFVSLSNLLTKPELLDLSFELKNTNSKSPLEEMGGVRAFEVVSQANTIEKTRSGVNASQFVGFDPITRTVAKKNISFGDVFANMKHAEDMPNFSSFVNRDGLDSTLAFDSKKVVSIFGTAKNFSNYIKTSDPTSLSKEDNFEKYIVQRKSIIENLMSKRIKAALPGNFQLTSGFNVNVIAPTLGVKDTGEGEDSSISGKYIITATRHIIGFEKHETVIEIATTSSTNDYVPTSNPMQTIELLDY